MDKKNKNPNVPNLRFSSFADPFRIYTLKEVLQRISFPVTVDENKLYYQIGIRSHSKGIFYKEAEIGKQIGNKRIFWIEPNCLILNIVFAWEQAVAKTSEKEVGMVASHRFPMYKVLNNSLDYIVDFFKTEKGKQLLQMASPGGAGRNKTLNQDFFLNSKIYLPSLNEQLKTTELIELIEDRIETQIKIIDDYNSLKMGIYNCMFKENYADYKLKQLAYIVKGDQINNDQLLSNGSYYMMNGGTSPSGYIDSYNVSENTISISEGGNSCGYVQFNSCPFWSGGHCYTIQNVNSALIENKYLYHYLKYKEKEIMNLRIGTGLPNIQKKDLENFTILVPSLLIQRKNLALFEMLDEKISILNEELANLQKQKKYLLCNMFI